MNKLNILNIGGDARQIHLINSLISHGYNVSSFGLYSDLLSEKCMLIENYKDALQTHNVVIGPTPFSKDGKQINTFKNDIVIYINELKSHLTTNHILIGGSIPSVLTDTLRKKNIPFYDLISDNSVAIKNAISTAEGAIAKAINLGPVNIGSSNCLVIGYGRCGKVIAPKLSGLGANVFIAARSKENIATAFSYGFELQNLETLKDNIHKYEFIFNTVPSKVLTDKHLSRVSPDVTIVDIASAPGGLDYDYVHKNKINAFLYLGIPGKVASKSSGIILADAIIDYFYERSD